MRIGCRGAGRRWLAVLLVLLAVAGQAGLPVVAKQHRGDGKVTPQIIHGQPVPAGGNPFMAALLHVNPDAKEQKPPFQRQFCGGSIIAPRAILTAAHCAVGQDPAKMQVLVGQTDLSGEGGALLDVLSLQVYPTYNAKLTMFDAAVVLLKQPIPAAFYHPIALVGSGDTQLERAGQPVTVSGWGARKAKADYDYPKQLYEVGINVVADSTCDSPRAYGDGFNPPTMLCAGATNPNRDSCWGDSGGPLFADTPGGPVEIGIVSWGRGCAQARYPGIYTRLSNPSINQFVRAASIWK